LSKAVSNIFGGGGSSGPSAEERAILAKQKKSAAEELQLETQEAKRRGQITFERAKGPSTLFKNYGSSKFGSS